MLQPGCAPDEPRRFRQSANSSSSVQRLSPDHRFTPLSEWFLYPRLEGAAREVDRLYKSISKDDRHTDVTKLYDPESTSSSSAGWSMGYYRVSDNGTELQDLPGYSPALTENCDPACIDLESEMTLYLLCLFKQYVRNSGTA